MKNDLFFRVFGCGQTVELERSILAFLPRNHIKMIPTVDLLFKAVDLQLSVHLCDPPPPIRKEKRTATSGWNFKCIQNIVNFIFRIQSRFYIIIQSNNGLSRPVLRCQLLVPVFRRACKSLKIPKNTSALVPSCCDWVEGRLRVWS